RRSADDPRRAHDSAPRSGLSFYKDGRPLAGATPWRKLVFPARLVLRRSLARAGPCVYVCEMNDVTRILTAIEQGDPEAADALFPIVYDELRRLAAHKLMHEKPGQTLQATALVHEAYLRLLGAQKAPRWDSRGHFFAAAAEAMRRILVNRARDKNRQKRGG